MAMYVFQCLSVHPTLSCPCCVYKCSFHLSVYSCCENRFLVIAFLPKSKRFLISWLLSLSTVILEPKIIKCVPVSTFSPWSYGTKWHDLSFVIRDVGLYEAPKKYKVIRWSNLGSISKVNRLYQNKPGFHNQELSRESKKLLQWW